MFKPLKNRLRDAFLLQQEYRVGNGIGVLDEIYHKQDQIHKHISRKYYDPTFSIESSQKISLFTTCRNVVYKYKEYIVKEADINSSEQLNSIMHEAYILEYLKDCAGIQKFSHMVLNDKVLYVFYHYIEAECFELYIEKLFVRDFDTNNLLIRLDSIIKTLKYLYENYKFTHYDMHLGNIIINNDNTTIIDFEFAYIELNNESYGATLSEGNLLITPQYYWPADIFKLLCCIKEKLSNMLGHVKTKIQNSYSEYVLELVSKGNTAKTISLWHFTQDLIERAKAIETKLPNSLIIKCIDELLSYFIEPDLYEQVCNKYYLPVCSDLFPQLEVDTGHVLDFYEYYMAVTSKYRNISNLLA